METNYFVYILKEIDGNRTYVGFTTNTTRRIKQHNGELAGGAKYTRGKKWEYAYLKKYSFKSDAMKGEFKLKKNYKLRNKIKSNFFKNE